MSQDLFGEVPMKECRCCRQSKPLDCFGMYDNGQGRRRRAKCQACFDVYRRAYRANGFRAPSRPPVTEKRCIDCKETKPIEDFAWQSRPDAKRRHRGSVCRPCRAKRCRDWAKIHGQTKARDSRFKKRYGITLADYNALLAKQNGVCGICKKPPSNNIDPRTKRPRRLAVDHSHKTGKVRGLLCAACNRALGNFQDDRSLLLSGVEYLDANP